MYTNPNLSLFVGGSVGVTVYTNPSLSLLVVFIYQYVCTNSSLLYVRYCSTNVVLL